MSTTPNMGLVQPTVGGSLDAWGTLLNAITDLIDSHDHTTGKGVKVPAAALQVDADIPWSFGGTARAITGAKGFGMGAQAAASLTAYSNLLFVNSSDNNLYFRNSSGTNVQVTSGSTLNVSIVGGIGGDYAAVSALLDYDDASDTYRLRQQVGAAVRQYGRAAVADLDLYEYKASGSTPVPTNRVRLSSPAALAASYALTFGAALPGSTSIAQVSSAGAITYSNTVANALTLSSSLSVGTTLGVTGLITASAGLTASANQHVIVSGSGRFKHGDLTYQRAVSGGFITNGTFTYTDAGVWDADVVNATIDYPVDIPVGARFKSASFTLDNTGVGTITCSLISSTGGAAPSTLATATRTGGGTGFSVTTITSTQTIAAATSYILRVFCNNAAHRVSGHEVVFDWA